MLVPEAPFRSPPGRQSRTVPPAFLVSQGQPPPLPSLSCCTASFATSLQADPPPHTHTPRVHVPVPTPAAEW